MQVTFHGVRGSIPSPGPATIRYGGNTVCIEVVLCDGTHLVLDAGTGLRRLADTRFAAAPPTAPIHLLITHVHWDHILGLPFFGPMWDPRARLVFHALSRRAESRLSYEALFDGEHFPVPRADIPAQLIRPGFQGESVRIGSATVRRVALNHPGECDGFRIDDADGKSLCYLTDNELCPPGPPRTSLDQLARFADRADLVIHDAQYLPQDLPEKHGRGHSLVADVLRLGQLCGTPRLLLFHHDPDRDDDALDRIGQAATDWLAQHAPATQAIVAHEGLSLST